MLSKLEEQELHKRIDRFVGELLASHALTESERDWQLEKAMTLKRWISENLR